MKKLKIIQRVVSICLFIVLILSPFNGVSKVHGTGDTTGTMTFTLPEFGNAVTVDGTVVDASKFTYSLDLQLLKYNSSGIIIANEWFKEIKVEEGTTTSTYSLTDGAIVLSGGSGGGYAEGTELTISDIPLTGDVYGYDPYVETKLIVKVICEELGYAVVFGKDDSVTIEVGDGKKFPTDYGNTYTLEKDTGVDDQGDSKDTLAALIDPANQDTYQYTYIDFMNYFNVVTLEGDIEGNHLVGPIISSNRAYRTLTTGLKVSDVLATGYPSAYNSGTLDASDYSNGIFSYVNTLTETGSGSPTFSLKYGYDAVGTQPEDRPYLYTKYTDTLIIKAGVWEVLEYIKVGSGQQFRSPNNEGRTDTLKNDGFINSTDLTAWMKADSSGLLAGATEVDAKSGTSVTIAAGGNYKIVNADQLETVNITWDTKYDFYTTPYPDPTTINFTTDLRSETYGGTKHYLFPEVTVNGDDMAWLADSDNDGDVDAGHPTGLNGEYANTSYSGNKIVWNFSDMTDRMILPNSNIPGHILAPEIEIWNYEVSGDAITWTGGNLNGAAVVKAFHGGIMELHMFPYGEAVSISTVEYSFIKYKESDSEGVLPGASFTVTGPAPATDVLGTFISGSDGIVTITGLEKGETYEMKETQAPNGYERSEDVWEIQVASDGTVTVDVQKDGVGSYTSLWTAGTVEADRKIYNTLKDFTLPNTGGEGVVFHYVIGMISIGMAALLIGRKKICG